MITSANMMLPDRPVTTADRTSVLASMHHRASSSPWVPSPLSTIRSIESRIFRSSKDSYRLYHEQVHRVIQRFELLVQQPQHAPPASLCHRPRMCRNARFSPLGQQESDVCPPPMLYGCLAHVDDDEWLAAYSKRAEHDISMEQNMVAFQAIQSELCEELERRTETLQATTMCRVCGKVGGVYITGYKQTRSADEPQTVYYFCELCGKSFRVG